MDTAMLIGYDWVTAVTYEAGHGWRVIYKSDMDDNILADGYLRSEDLYDEHPIQQGMDAMNAVASEDEDEATPYERVLSASSRTIVDGCQ